jgi:predicted oxidoreductase
MKTTVLGKSELVSSRLVYGCMRICGDNSPADREKGKNVIRAAIDAGYNHFDHADIYGGGECETLFSGLLKESPHLRDKILVTGKCGIRLQDKPEKGFPKRYDFSRKHIIDSVEGSLRRLGVDHLDVLLLHRPDFLFDPANVAGTFRILQEEGKVRHFGASNFSASQFALLQEFWPEPMLSNQACAYPRWPGVRWAAWSTRPGEIPCQRRTRVAFLRNWIPRQRNMKLSAGS